MPVAPALSWLHPGVERRPSDVAGRGLFCTVDVPAGTVVGRLARVPDSRDAASLDGWPGNHGCDPDLGWADRTTLVAMHDVPADQELLTDYALALSDPAFLLRCHCESYRCRQMVAGDDWRIPQLQARYEGWWAPDVQALVDAGRR